MRQKPCAYYWRTWRRLLLLNRRLWSAQAYGRAKYVRMDSVIGPVTVTIEYVIANDHRDEFQRLMQEVQATIRRNGAFHCRLDECLEDPGKFRLEYVVSTWAEHLRQNMRMTADETQVFKGEPL